MTTPRFIPRKYLRPGYVFGRAALPAQAWETPSRDQGKPDDLYAIAARIQSDLLVQMDAIMTHTSTTPSEIMRWGNFSKQRWQRLLRGDVVLRLEDLAALELATGYTITIKAVDTWGRGVDAVKAHHHAEEVALNQRERVLRNSRALQQPHRSSPRE